MMHRFVAAATALLTLSPLSAQAAEKTVLLTVHHADCTLCGPIVKKTLERVTGVKAVTVSQPGAEADVNARVSFDDSVTRVSSLIAATTKVGYPAEVAKKAP